MYLLLPQLLCCNPQVLEEGIADRPGDIDVVWAYGYAWPRYVALHNTVHHQMLLWIY
jgi:hypothetical protein